MAELKLYVTIAVEDEFFSDVDYPDHIAYVISMLKDTAESWGGSVTDLEVK